ncbi:Yip1 family protein [Caldicellulosiruptor naganoensis]|uniref:YIP1 family protein n=1 Tax=Caldicellulosiruptor naganoensis TaxID=29324 RepID=A0ABY7BGD2_9FIRM|nr:Yip1 family protein [Caldicellulosiruptor naganoensis]WAM31151.1 YIP1 family protein [Caldicellulosiruptor naganoensis]
MTKCPYCGRELQEGEVCTCQTNQTMVSQTTGNQVTSGEALNDTQNTAKASEDVKSESIEQTVNTAEEKKKESTNTSTLNDVINSAVRYCYLTIKFAWAFLKNPFVFISKVIQNNDYKAGILFAILTFIFVSIQNLVLAGRGLQFIEDLIEISGILSSYSSFKTFLYNFIALFLLYLLYCGIVKLASMIFKEDVEFKAILGGIGVSLIPFAWAAIVNLILQFIAVWLVVLLCMLGLLMNVVLNFWSVKVLLKDKETRALYITVGAYIVCIIIVAVIMFAMGSGIANSGGENVISVGSDNIIGTWSDNKDTIIFYPNGTFKAHYYWIGGAWEIDGNKLYLTGTLTGKEGYYFKIEGKKLILEPIPGSGMGRYEFYRVR